ncbi:MAG: S8/S53 family peptidase [Chitinophagales bacterium]
MSVFLRIIFSLCFILLVNIVLAKGSALLFCSDHSQEEALKWAENNQLTYIAFLEYENVLLVEETSVYTETRATELCFVSELRNFKNHIAFSKNEIILRIQSGNEKEMQGFFEALGISDLEKHAFIPNQYKMKNAADNEAALDKLLAEIKKQSWVKVAQINTAHTLSVTSVDDPLFDSQWSIQNTGDSIQGNGTVGADMSVDSAWTISTGSSDIKIVILDSGVDTLHEDLIDNMLPGYDAFADSTQDTKGYPTPNFRSDGHGTACAGIAAASGNNSTGVAGIAYSSKIVPVRIFYYQDFGSNGIQPFTNSEALINGSAYAWREANGDIMSTSAGLPDVFIFALGINTAVMNAEIAEAYQQGRGGKGIPMFFSSGNDDAHVLWPAKLENITIAVGANSMCDERKNPNDCSSESWGSNYGTNLDFVAPGVLISSTDMSGNNGYTNNNYTNTFNGTSASCPNAAGVGALILSVNPNLGAQDVKAILSLSADKVAPYHYDSTLQYGAWNNEMGYGRINAFEALKLAQDYTPTVGIKDNTAIDKSNPLKIYPNPSSGVVFVENSNEEVLNVQVYNLEGKQIKSIRLAGNSKANMHLSNGFYLIGTVNNNGISQVKKIVVAE